eukprot:1613022-Rhodomonas_salina.1
MTCECGAAARDCLHSKRGALPVLFWTREVDCVLQSGLQVQEMVNGFGNLFDYLHKKKARLTSVFRSPFPGAFRTDGVFGGVRCAARVWR